MTSPDVLVAASGLGREDKVFAAFMAVCFGLLAVDRLTRGALEAAYSAWRAAP